MDTVRALTARGLEVTLDHLGEDVTDRATAHATRDAYLRLLEALGADGPRPTAPRSRSSSRPSARRCPTAATTSRWRTSAGSAELATGSRHHRHPRHGGPHHRRLDAGRPARAAPRPPAAPARSLQSYLFRTEDDARDLAVRRLPGPAGQGRLRRARRRSPSRTKATSTGPTCAACASCSRATATRWSARTTPRMIAIAQRPRRARPAAPPGTYEFQMLYGIRTAEQRRLARRGERMRIYVPYGADWYGYFMRRLAERPANLAFFLRSFVPVGR